jgi:hydroxymethylbilane synthase
VDSKLRIGTRGSKLALWQAHFTQSLLKEQNIDSELVIIKTKGDQIQHLSFDKIEGKGIFTKEIETALLEGEIDLAVHSMKDMPTTQPEGLVLTAVSYRENPADWLVIRKSSADPKQLFGFKEKAVIGTSSARRKAQMLDFRPDIELKDIRGNVPTRLQKLRDEQFDAILLAAAGLTRLEIDLSEFVVQQFNPKEFVPAPAQGVLCYQTKVEDKATRRILQKLHHPEVAKATNVERKILKLLDGGCHMPLGAYCERDTSGNYHVWAAHAKTSDSPVKRVKFSSSTSFKLADQVVEALKNE